MPPTKKRKARGACSPPTPALRGGTLSPRTPRYVTLVCHDSGSPSSPSPSPTPSSKRVPKTNSAEPLSTLRPKAKRLAIFALGKGALAAARTAEDVFAERPLEGLVVTPQGFAAQKDVKHLEVLETSHPLPDASSEAAGNRILSLASSLSEADAAICLISGGASACATATIPPLELADKINLSATLLRGGAAIETSQRGAKASLRASRAGRLACAIFPAETFSFVASDVIGDDPSVIASGPTVADPTTQAETRDILRRYGAEGSSRLEAVLCDPRNESPKPDEARLSRSARPLLVSRPRDMLDRRETPP